jgi:parvulin-like peptidyl-prolyl isomerase
VPLHRWFLLPVLGVLVALAAACGGGDGGDASSTEVTSTVEVPADAVAVVGETALLRTDFDRLFRQAEAAYEAQGREFPAPGTPEYEQLKNETVDFLIQRIEFEREAEALGITVTEQEVSDRLTELKQQFFEGDEKVYQEELEKQGITEADVLADLRAQIISRKIFEEVTKGEAVTDEEVDTYYAENQEESTTPESREVAHILVDDKKLADDLYAQLEEGADFEELAKKHSTDTGSAEEGGKLTDVRGSFVPEFEEVAFALETGEIGKPVESQFGWHIIKALADTTPEETTSLDEVRDSIRDQLLQDKQNKAMAAWVEEARAKFADQIAYATGFAPATTGTLPVGTGAETGQ